MCDCAVHHLSCHLYSVLVCMSVVRHIYTIVTVHECVVACLHGSELVGLAYAVTIGVLVYLRGLAGHPNVCVVCAWKLAVSTR
jgi:hypothetical protein